MVQVLCPVMVGRKDERRAAAVALERAVDGYGGCLVVTGEAGIGKSRLVRELAREASARGVPVATGRAVPAGSSAAYRPLAGAILQAIRERGMPDDPGLDPWLPAISAVVPGIRRMEGEPSELSGTMRNEAVVQLLRRLASPNGLLLLLEDLHWADPDTLAVVEYLGDNLPGSPILCAVTIRTETSSPALRLVRQMRGRPEVTQLELARFDSSDVSAMVRACVPDATATLIERVERTADGIPFLIEEVLASPGLPTSFADMIAERLALFGPDGRLALEAAAVLGRHFDWELLPAMVNIPSRIVTDALGLAVERLLLHVEEGSFRFRHALTREAVLDGVLPPRQRELAAAGLAAVTAAHPELDGPWRDLAADLARRAGDRERAGVLLADAGRSALDRGALATAVETLGRAMELMDAGERRCDAALVLIEALALAGRVEEASSLGAATITSLDQSDPGGLRRAEVHLHLAQAAVAASRWAVATENLHAARRVRCGPPSAFDARIAVLEAEIALGSHDVDAARRLANEIVTDEQASAESRCHALEVVGRVDRLGDPRSARASFDRALAIAEAGGLSVWRLRALHELGTVDMFDHLGTDRLEEARRTAQELGALGTLAVVDLQLAAVSIGRWASDDASGHALEALELAERLGLVEVQAKARLFLAESHALRAESHEAERELAMARVPGSRDPAFDGFAWGCRGEAALAGGDLGEAVAHLERATGILDRLPYAEPAAFRAVWPLLLASSADRRAVAATERARRLGVGAFRLNQGLIGYADAIVAGRSGDHELATAIALDADRAMRRRGWGDLARFLAADAAMSHGWGEPHRWLADAGDAFAGLGLFGLADRCAELLGAARAGPWERFGVTAREEQVVRLVALGLANKEIAAQLRVSPRTVEKHVEALLRKTSLRTRTQLAVLASGPLAASATTGAGSEGH